jgi:proteic killer suppression protein
MIRSYRNKALRRFAETGNPKGLSVKQVDRVRRILAMLDKAKGPRDMDQPGLMFHGLPYHGGRYAVRVTGNFRITFGWNEGPVDVDLEDYH